MVASTDLIDESFLHFFLTLWHEDEYENVPQLFDVCDGKKVLRAFAKASNNGGGVPIEQNFSDGLGGNLAANSECRYF